MKSLFDDISVACSKNITKTYSSSFSMGIKFLAPAMRNPIYSIYGYVRLADEIVDSFEGYKQLEMLEELKVETRKALDHKISLNPIINSFQQVVHQYEISTDLIDSFLESMEMDLNKKTYNLEMYVAGTARQAMISVETSQDQKYYEMMDRLVSAARRTYRRLLDHPDFINFYSKATPIDVLEQSKIGSRPSRRTGQRSLNDLRSIPWVFSWNQSRFNLSGWFGIGIALDEFHRQYPDDFEQLKRLARDWSFLKYSLVQIESNLLNSDPKIMQAFADLVEGSQARGELMDLILTDYQTCLQKIEDIMGASKEVRRISKLEDNKLRNNALNLLHAMQIESLKKWRSLRETDPQQSDQYLLRLLLLVNAISGGLKGTG